MNERMTLWVDKGMKKMNENVKEHTREWTERQWVK